MTRSANFPQLCYAQHVRTQALLFLSLAISVGCQPRPRRELFDAQTDEDASAIMAFERPAVPDIVTPEAGLDTDANVGSPEIPPLGRQAIMRWIEARHYRRAEDGLWFCQPRVHAATVPSPHQFEKVCINRTLASTRMAQEFPVGSSAVKELFAADMVTIIGYAVTIKVLPGNTGEAWYWFEQIPGAPANPGLPHPIEADGTISDGLGIRGSGNAGDLCASCHAQAGTVAFPAPAWNYVFTTTPDPY